MSAVYEELVESVQDILPMLTAYQTAELNEMIDNGDIEIAEYYLNYLAKQYRVHETS